MKKNEDWLSIQPRTGYFNAGTKKRPPIDPTVATVSPPAGYLPSACWLPPSPPPPPAVLAGALGVVALRERTDRVPGPVQHRRERTAVVGAMRTIRYVPPLSST